MAPMLEVFTNLFDSESFMPHGHCYLWRPDILWLNVASDAVIAIAYYVIPLFLVYFVQKRKDLAFNWIFVMFALFILACGTTHVVGIWTVWNPNYGTQGLVKLFTAGVSLATAIALVPLMPKAIKLPSAQDMDEKNRELAQVNQELRQLNATLTSRVEEKTRDVAMLAAIVNSSNDAIVGKDIKGNITSWNAAAEKLFGFDANDVIGQSIYTIVPQERRDEMLTLMAKAGQGETTESHDTTRLTKKGEIIDISLTISPIMDATGRIIGSSSISRDITARKSIERELHKSEVRKAAILNASLEAIITIDHVGKVIDWNHAAEQTFGFDHGEAIGREIADLIIPLRFRAAHREGLARYMETGEGAILGKRLELPGLVAGGGEVPMELSISVILIGNEMPLFTASVRDISDRKRSEDTLRKIQERFRNVIESAPNGLLMVSRDGKITLCNSKIVSLFGYTREELLGQEIENLVPDRYSPSQSTYRTIFFANPESTQIAAGRELFGRRNDGKEFPVELDLTPIETEDETFMLASIVDITMRKALEVSIKTALKSLQKKNVEMEQFVYTVSHDLKSPLVTSTGFLGLLRQDMEAGRYDLVADSIGRLERANARMAQLIDDLLQLSRIGRIKPAFERIEMATMLQGICENLSPQIKEKQVTVTIQDSMPTILADRKCVYQAFDNLMNNALKYASDVAAPEIAIGSEEHESETYFFVRDNGPGIAAQYHKKIFGLFQRLETDSRGTGVGLTIVSRIMQQHGGRVWVESTPGSGATFWLAFPKVPASPDSEDHHDG